MFSVTHVLPQFSIMPYLTRLMVSVNQPSPINFSFLSHKAKVVSLRSYQNQKTFAELYFMASSICRFPNKNMLSNALKFLKFKQ